MTLKLVRDMTKKEKEKLWNEVWNRKSITAGGGKIGDDMLTIEKYGYVNSYRWTVLGWDKKTKRIKYGRYTGQRVW